MKKHGNGQAYDVENPPMSEIVKLNDDDLRLTLCHAHVEYADGVPVGYGPLINPDGPQAAARITALLDESHRLTTTLENARKDAWQPIETAPRDGTEVLLWIDGDEESPRKGAWNELMDDPRRKHRWCVAYGWCEDNPTHWQPLPEPPSLIPPTEKAT